MSLYVGYLLDLVVAQHLVEKWPYSKGDDYGQGFRRHTGPNGSNLWGLLVHYLESENK